MQNETIDEAVSFLFLDPDSNLVEFWSPSPRGLEGPPSVLTDSSSPAERS